MTDWSKNLRGYKGGSDKPRTPIEAPDSLVSTQFARIVDLISEGEIYGLVGDASGVFLDETPSTNFPSFTYEMRNGTQDQSYLAGFPAVESNVTISVELQAATPWIRSVTDLNLSAIRLNFSVPRLSQQSLANGDVSGYTVSFSVDVRPAGGMWEEVLSSAFSGKTTGGYTRSVRIDLPGQPPGGWEVRVRRTTPHATGSNISDAIYLQTITEIVDAKFRYPNSAVIGMQFDAEVFGGKIPKRGYRIRGRLIRVPSNYDAESRTYTGFWDGTFKIEYSNNPAWVYYDLLLHPRFGLGTHINAGQVDKWSVYEIGRYCDQMVDDGKGGLEPRFTCNLYLQTRADALKVLQDIASIFRGITYWGAGQAVLSADMPSDPVYTYTNANVREGRFSYKGSKRNTRYSVALVSWNDPADMYRAKVEYVQDDALVARYGIREISLTAIGCSSQGQAQRAGRWALLTNQYETDLVTFSTGIEGIRAMPGQVIRIADARRAGKRIGGRLKAATNTDLTLDQNLAPTTPVMAGDDSVMAGDESVMAGSGAGESQIDVGDEITCILPNGTAQTRTILQILDVNKVRVSPAFDEAPVPHSVWAHESAELRAQLFRINSITESGPMEFAIAAIKYQPDKHAAIDYGTIISQRPVTQIPTSVQPVPTDIVVTSDHMIDQYQAVSTMTISWTAAPGALRYDVEWKRNDSDWVYAGRVGATEVDVQGIYSGEYIVRVRAINVLDIMSPWAVHGPVMLLGKTSLPPAPVGVTTTSEVFAIRVRWGVPVGAEDTAYSELQMGVMNNDPNPIGLGRFAYPTNVYLQSGMAAAVVRWFRVRLIDKTGNIGPWSAWVYGISSTNATEILDYLGGQITDTQLSQELLEQIESGGGAAAEIEEIRETVNDLDQGLSAMYAIKLGINQDGQYYAAGMGIGIENTPGGMQSQVLFLADRFAVMHQIDGTPVFPFIIEDGQVIMNNAVIGEATISWLKIGDDVQSTNYVPNTSGWRLSKNGNLEFNGAIAGGGRMNINNQTVRVYDSNGVMRVRMGIWI